MKTTLRTILAISVSCLATFCASLEQQVITDGKQIINARLAQGEKKIGL